MNKESEATTTIERHTDVFGFDVWTTLIQKLGTYDVKTPSFTDHNSFTDLMLKEWTNERLVWELDDNDIDKNGPIVLKKETEVANKIIRPNELLEDSSNYRQPSLNGTVIRSSSKDPFLLQSQFLHMSTILIYQDEPTFTVGLILNLPTTETWTTTTPKGNTVSFVVRHGGPNGDDDDEDEEYDDYDDDEDDYLNSQIATDTESMIWLHLSPTLRDLGVGRPIGAVEDRRVEHVHRPSTTSTSFSKLWTCSYDQVVKSIDAGYALPREFMLIRGYTLWEKISLDVDDDEDDSDDNDKEESDGDGGIQEQIDAGYFDIVAPDLCEYVWPLLLSQDILSSEISIDTNLKLIKNAWHLGSLKSTTIQGRNNSLDYNKQSNNRSARNTSIALKQAIIDQTDLSDIDKSTMQEPKQYVYGSNVEISELKYEALRVWMNLFLLDNSEYQARRFEK